MATKYTKPISAAKVKRIVKMRDDGYFQWAICERIGVSQRTVQRVLLEHDRTAFYETRLHGQTRKAVERRIAQGMSTSKIMQILAVSSDTVKRLRVKMAQ